VELVPHWISFSGSRNTPPSSFPASTSDMQEQMRDQMKDPTMQQMFTSMMKYLSPENMATISEHLGINSQEDEDKAQQAMSSLSPEDSDKTM
jgi:hypothetical protein